MWQVCLKALVSETKTTGSMTNVLTQNSQKNILHHTMSFANVKELFKEKKKKLLTLQKSKQRLTTM